jgi:Zn-dependent protease with chaperone function
MRLIAVWIHTDMQTDLEGYYMDGQTAERRRVRVRLTRTGLHILLENGGVLSWPLEEIRQPGNFFGEDQIRLERGGDTPEVLTASRALFLKIAHDVWPDSKKRFHAPGRSRKRIGAVLLSAAAAAGVICGLYFWGIPALSSFLAPRIPVDWEEQLGQSVVEQLAPPGQQCGDAARARKVEEILATLAASVPRAPYTFRVIVVNNPSVNALAIPGGTIVVYQGLLEKTRTAEELAGVLAHEMQHILRRHATRALLQQASMKFLLAAAVGDAKGLSYGLEGATALGILRYSRQYEEEADAEGIRMLIASGIDPRGFYTFFETIQKDGERSLKIPAYLSTHPDMEGRIQRLKALAAGAPAPRTRLLPGYDWKDIHAFCSAKPGRNPAHQ